MEVRGSLSLEEIQAFLEASGEVGFKGGNREEVYEWINRALRGQRYQELKRSGRGLVRRYAEKMTGLSRAQVTRLITLYLSGEEVKAKTYRRRCFVVEVQCGVDWPGRLLRCRVQASVSWLSHALK